MVDSIKKIGALCIVAGLAGNTWAADPADPATPAPTPAEIAKVKAQLDEQRKLIEKLQAAIDAQEKMLEQAGAATPQLQAQHTTPAQGLVASTTPMIPLAPAPAATTPATAPRFDKPTPQAASATSAPLQILIGERDFNPVCPFHAILVSDGCHRRLQSRRGRSAVKRESELRSIKWQRHVTLSPLRFADR